MVQDTTQVLPDVKTTSTFRDRVNAKRASFIAMLNEGGFKQAFGKWEDDEGGVCFLELANLHAAQR